MKKIVLFILFFIVNFYYSQQLHVRYIKVLSPYTTSHEDLYIKNNQVLSIQDSIISTNNNAGEWTMSVQMNGSRKITKEYYVSDINEDGEKAFFFTSYVDTKDFFIYDKVPKIKWSIDETETKIVAKYKCYKATGNFRGSNIVAYFTKDLPYSAGPFKFFGLPGLILDIKVENKAYNIWKAESVNLNDTTNIVYKPKFLNKNKISMRNYIEAKEEHMNKTFAKVKDAVTSQYKNVMTTTQQRFGIEQKFEWESNTGN